MIVNVFRIILGSYESIFQFLTREYSLLSTKFSDQIIIPQLAKTLAALDYRGHSGVTSFR